MPNSKDIQIRDKDTLLAAMAHGWQPKFLLFWGHTPKSAGIGKHVLSQWWPTRFEIGGHGYVSAEHYMMAEKARLFGDEETRLHILQAAKPGAAKAFGRAVRGFDEEIWARHRFRIVVEASTAKFGQDEELRGYLLRTGDMVLVEASPVDAVWGIGHAADDPAALEPARWRGLNLLGFALMQARAALAGDRTA